LTVDELDSLINFIPNATLEMPDTDITVAATTTLVLATDDDALLGNLRIESGADLALQGAAAAVVNNLTGAAGSTIDGTVVVEGILGLDGPVGALSIDGELELGDDATYMARFNGAGNDLVDVGGDVYVGGTLDLVGVGSLAAVGDTSRVVMSTSGESAIDGEFTAAPLAGDHLGAGIFASNQGPNGQVVTYSDTEVTVDLFQAIAGDTDGNRDVNGFDIQAILSANKFGKPLAADWTEGDFTGDGFVNGFDIQAILSANQFGKGPYAAAEVAVGGASAVPEPGTIVMLLAGLAGLLMVWRRRAA
jgi:hypothetical protein